MCIDVNEVMRLIRHAQDIRLATHETCNEYILERLSREALQVTLELEQALQGISNGTIDVDALACSLF